MPDGSIYRDLSVEMRDGLKTIYKQLSSASAVGNPEALFNDASDQLREVVRETETAAMNIMELIERQLEQTTANAAILAVLRKQFGANAGLDELDRNNDQLAQSLTAMLTALSFQDITGQRIKKVMAALDIMESSVIELYLTSGLVIEAADKEPAKEAEVIKADAQKAVEEFRENRNSELKGPDKNGVSQAAIDDMLAQLGL